MLDTAVTDAEQDNYWQACRVIARQVQESGRILSVRDILKIARKVSCSYGLATLPKNEHIMQHIHDKRQRSVLAVRPVKTASGVAVIAVMPKPFECPHGKCIYCPGGIEFNTPLSYTGTEPSTRIAQAVRYDPYEQVATKIRQLQSRGHETGKIELVIVGGTFPFMPEQYQKEFAKCCYDALNGFRAASLADAIRANETAEKRCVGFTVETKPDYCKRQHIDLMLDMGITRVEIGVQSLRNSVYKAVNRGHTLDDVKDSFAIARDAGYKIVAHMMPGLPGSSVQQDLEDFKRLFDDQAFRPDMLKIYPTLVLKNTGLYELYRRGSYFAYSDNDLVNLLVEVKKMIPPWVRIMRVQREIESKDIVAGPKDGNLRQVVLERLRQQGLECKCIRCREPGLQHDRTGTADQVKEETAGLADESKVRMEKIVYTASAGQEVFLSFVKDKFTIIGFLRLRIPANPHRIELQDSAIVRELHIYGQALSVGQRISATGTGEAGGPEQRYYQHSGYGAKLMSEAERIAREEFGIYKLSVISAVGTREYYRKLGYTQNGPYVSKDL